MWAFKASWLALVTWHPGMGHFSRCRDALDVPAPAKAIHALLQDQGEQSCWNLVPSSQERPPSSAAPPCRFWEVCLHPPLRRRRRPTVLRFFFLEMFPALLAALALALSPAQLFVILN